MAKSASESTATDSLRRLAEDRLAKTCRDIDTLSPTDLGELVHELEVHQIELEMQNEELRRIQFELEASRDSYVDLYDFAPVGYLTLDQAGVILEANLTAAMLLNTDRKSLIGKRLHHFVRSSDQDELYIHNQHVFAVAGKHTCEIRLRTPDDAPLHVRIESIAVGTEGEVGHKCRTALIDITEGKRAEAARHTLEVQMYHTQKLECLGVLAGGVAHDFNNLLSGIIGNAQLALHDLPLKSPVRGLIQTIDQAANRAAELTNQLLAYSGKGRFVVEPVDLSKVVEEMVRLLRASVSKKAALKLRCRTDLPIIEADASQIRQVVMNLITNASDAIGDDSGAITICTGDMEADREYLAASGTSDVLPEGRYAYVEVADTGCGMDKEAQARMFEPFFTTKFTGRGLGLAAVLGIVRGHDGVLKVDSAAARGTVIRVLFPVSARQAAPAKQQQEARPEQAHPAATVLVVDDEELVRAVATMTLSRYGFTVLNASDGYEALEVFRKRKEEIDAVLLDMTMPRLSGEEVLQELRKIRPDVCVVLSSGYDERQATDRLAGGEPYGFLQKPYAPTALAEKMSAAVRGQRCP